MIYLAAASAALVALVVAYMARPTFTPVKQSARKFFPVTAAASSEKRFTWSRPRPTRLFFVQLTVIALLFLAILAYFAPPRIALSGQLGIWIIVDRSASMSTIQGAGKRMGLALSELGRVAEMPWPPDHCFRLSAFDLGLQLLDDDLRSAREVVRAASDLRERPLGTDLTLVQRALGEPRGDRPSGCRVDVVVVITDVPAPPWMDRAPSPGDAWIDVSRPVGNIGFTQVDGVRNPLTGGVELVRVQFGAFGGMRDRARLTVQFPERSPIERESGPWVDDRRIEDVRPDRPGIYRFRVSPGGAYAYDDAVEISVPAVNDVRVDWRAGRPDLAVRLGWIPDSESPDLRVLPAASALDERPTVLVGSGYARGRAAVQPIADFVEVSPLLDALNFDVAERLRMPAPATLRDDFKPVMRGENGVVWFAQRETPPAAYVPGLPLEGDDSAARFSATAFFNAVRWVLQRRAIAPLFRLTSLDDPEPHGNVLALHPGEGDTGRASRSVPSVDVASLSASAVTTERRHLWPWVLLLAAGMFVAERWLALVRGWQ